MPLKPIFDKAPLKSAVSLPLRPGQVHAEIAVISSLLSLVQDAENKPVLWEGLVRAGLLTETHPEKLPVVSWIESALSSQSDDGSLPFSLPESLAVMRAAFALYESTSQRSLIEHIARWCGSLNDTWEQTIDQAAIRQHPADLMELLEDMYRVSGKRALLSLMEKLRRSGMDWAGILHTFAVQRPMSKQISWADLSSGMKAEENHEDGYYTRQALICQSVSLADGARSAWMNGLFSGNGQELSACEAGWERISRYHGAVCGGTTGDDMLEGTSPAAGIDAAALGAWCEALSLASVNENGGPLLENAERMLLNAIPHSVLNGELHSIQFVNSIHGKTVRSGLYHYEDSSEQKDYVLARLLRGSASVVYHAVTARRDGLDLRLLLDGTYAVLVGKELVRVTIQHTSGHAKVSFSMKEPLLAQVHVSVPKWATDFDVAVNQDGADRGTPGKDIVLDRTWQNGDTLTLVWDETPHTLSGHHQGLYVMQGPMLMCMPADVSTPWQTAMAEPASIAEDGQLCIQVAPIDWKLRNSRPEDLPVLPKVQGDSLTVNLVPYAEAEGIALFPKGTRA